MAGFMAMQSGEPTEDAGDELIKAACAGNLDKVKKMIDGGLSVDTRDAEGLTVLAFAALEGRFEVVEFLVGRGANVNASGYRQRTALMLAAFHDHFEITKFLIENKADVSAKDADGLKARDYAHFAASYDVRRFLESAEIASGEISRSSAALARLKRGMAKQKVI